MSVFVDENVDWYQLHRDGMPSLSIPIVGPGEHLYFWSDYFNETKVTELIEQ